MPTKISDDNAHAFKVAKSVTTKNHLNGKWLVIKSGAGKGMSVPEYFTNKPRKFFEEFFNDGDFVELEYQNSHERDVADQAYTIVGELKRIEIPPHYKDKDYLSVIAVCNPPKKYEIEIVTDRKRFRELFVWSGGNVSSVAFNKLFDQFLFLYTLGAPASVLKDAVDYALSEVSGEKRGNWNRAKCDWFFNTRDHFRG